MTPNNIKPDSANNDVKQEEHITFSVHDLIQTVIANWYWFVISVIVCVGCSYIYILRTPKIYSRTANILVKDSRKGGDTNLAALSDLAGLSQMRNVDNEIYILQSRRLMTEVVKQLGLTVQYETKEGLRPQDLYGQNPIAVDFINDNDRQGFRFEVSLYPDSIVKLNRFEIFGPDKQKFKQEITGMFGDTISTPVGQMIIRPTLYMSSDYYEKAPIRVTKGNLGVVTQFYQHEVKSFVANKQASIITISMRSSVPKKAEDVINTLIAVYEKDAIDDKRGIAESTGQFIDNRLAIISGELSEVDRNIEKFKKDNKIYDIVSEAEQTITESAQYKVDGLSLENQIRMTEFLKEYLLDPAKANELIPGTLSINSPAINTQIDAYNTELQRYMKLNSDNSGNNPIVQDLGNGLASTRRSIIATLDSYISTLQIQLAALRREEALTNQRISSVPTQEKQILDIVRQQKIKEELYLYLLNKREENAITMVITESNSRTIDSAYGSPRPVSPNTVLIAGIAFLFGLGIPFLVIYLIQILDTTIRGRKDIEDNLSVPFLGDIPQYSGEKATGKLRRTRKRPRSGVGSFPHDPLEHELHEPGQGRDKSYYDHLVESPRRKDVRFDQPGHDVRHDGQEGRHHGPGPAAPHPLQTNGARRGYQRHFQLPVRKYGASGDHPQIQTVGKPRHHLRRHPAAQPERNAVEPADGRVDRGTETPLRLHNYRQHPGDGRSGRHHHRPPGRPQHLRSTGRPARPSSVAGYRTAVSRKEIP